MWAHILKVGSKRAAYYSYCLPCFAGTHVLYMRRRNTPHWQTMLLTSLPLAHLDRCTLICP